MSKYVNMKRIVVKSAGTLSLLSGVAGPILTPFPCKVDKIRELIITGKDVYEVIGDTELKLDLDNYNTDNTVLENKNINKKDDEPHYQDNNSVEDDIIVDEKGESEVTETVEEASTEQKPNNNNKKNKNRK